MQANLVVYFLNEDVLLKEEILELILDLLFQRHLLILNYVAGVNILMVWVEGEQQDIFALTNAIASGFSHVQVKLERYILTTSADIDFHYNEAAVENKVG